MLHRVRYLDEHGIDCAVFIHAINAYEARKIFAMIGPYQILTVEVVPRCR